MATQPTSHTLLVVDDNEASLYAKSRLLRHCGFSVVEARTGGEGLQLATTLKPSLVLLDVNLPDINGLEVCRQIKSNSAFSSVFVLQISASLISAQDKATALEGGADAYLMEPVEPEELIATVRALLRLQQSETALRQSEERYRLLVENANDIVYTVDHKGRLLTVNRAAERITGYTQAELLDRSIKDLVTPEYLPISHAMLHQKLTGTTNTVYEVEIFAKDGRRVALEVNSRLTYEDNQVVGVQGIAREVTERKQAEQALKNLNETLEQRVAERTADLARSNRELDQFAYVASHDLKAPLRAIDHLARWIIEDLGEDLPPTTQEHLAKLQSRVQRMATLLDDLLAYSRAGRIQHATETVDTRVLVKDIIESLGPSTTFTVSLSEVMPRIRTERVPLELVLRNLISNAIKHHDRLIGHIQITAQAYDACIEFAVADDGPGIDEQMHGRIFEMFQTLQPRDKIEGSGIGLAIVKKVVESRGGVITVESAVGQGATFRFTWPVTATPPPTPRQVREG